jgi:hypothetical protein
MIAARFASSQSCRARADHQRHHPDASTHRAAPADRCASPSAHNLVAVPCALC